MSDEHAPAEATPNPLMAFILSNRSWMSAGSMLMILYAVWAVIEVFSNTYFHELQGITILETGTETNINPDDLQRNNSGWVMASGAILGSLGLYAQYVYRAAPYVDASMAATAAMILKEASSERMGEEEILAKAEEAAVAAAAEVAKETAEDTVIEMLDPDADRDEEEDEDDAEDEAEEEAEDEAEEEAEDEGEDDAEDEGEDDAEDEAEEAAEEEAEDDSEEEEEEAPPEEKKKF